jgi:pimeloyl-ACP methyl ester carboxylesterase
MGGPVTVSALADGGRASRLAFLAAPDDVGWLTRRTAVAMGFQASLYDVFQRIAERKFDVRFEDYVISNSAPGRGEPILAVHDAEDREVPLAEAERWIKAWRGAESVVTQGLGHTRILRDPAVVERVVDFLTNDGLSVAAAPAGEAVAR